MNLTDGNGREILMHIKTNSPQQKVVVVSGCDIERKNAFDHGALFFMAKPFTRKNLEHVIRIILPDK
jgi:DNA-binding response OmpR family regulator